MHFHNCKTYVICYYFCDPYIYFSIKCYGPVSLRNKLCILEFYAHTCLGTNIKLKCSCDFKLLCVILTTHANVYVHTIGEFYNLHALIKFL